MTQAGGVRRPALGQARRACAASLATGLQFGTKIASIPDQ